ncbi:hypothetical protein AAVH_42385 [Aphelenchoides avenae]|nr:hypothetical protein AAVH_42385 [Aphelenchus avenae]
MQDFQRLAQLPLVTLSLHGSVLRGSWIDNFFLLRMTKSLMQLDFRAHLPRDDALFHVDNDGILAFCCALPQEQYGDYTEPRRLDLQHATLQSGLFTRLMQLHTERRLCKRLFVQLAPVPEDLVGELAAYNDYCSGSQWCRYHRGGLTLQGKWYNFPRGLSVHFSREWGGIAGPLTCTITCVS